MPTPQTSVSSNPAPGRAGAREAQRPAAAGRGTALPTVALAVAMYALWLGNVAWYAWAPLPVVFHVALSALAIHLAFTVWHEGVHRNISRNPVVNDTVAVLGVLPYMAPYFLEKWFHLQHHALLNQESDPNAIYTDGPFRTLPLRYVRILLYAKQRMVDDPRRPWQKAADVVPPLLVVAVCGVALWRGFFLDVVWLWLLPMAIAKVVMDAYINYLPHVGLPPDRYRGTRVVDVPWLTPLVLFHNYHAVHHLWPGVPWYRYREIFRRRRDELAARGVPIARRLRGCLDAPAGRAAAA